MDTPTPTPIPNAESPTPAAPAPRPRSARRALAVAGLAGAVAIAGVGYVGLTDADDTPARDRNERTVADLIADTVDDDLGDVTLDELAARLAEMGLEVTVRPTEGDDASMDDSDPTPSSDDADPEPPEEPAEVADDPFAGMTDAEIDALSDEEFFSMLDEAGWTVDDDGWIVPGDEASGSPDHDHDAFDETAAVFTVDGDQVTPTDGDADAVAEGEALWQRFVELIPADQRQMLVGFEVIAERGGGGYVYPDDADPTRWHLGISPGLGDDLDWVLIHEFAHLLTLQAEEVPPSIDDGSCPTYHTGEGCSLKGSTMNEFVERFWPKAQIDEIFTAQENEDWDALDRFYEEHQDDFVTDYATTNPAEDLAETFTVFVLNDRPTGDTIADQKVEFLWNDPDLVELRERIRSAR